MTAVSIMKNPYRMKKMKGKNILIKYLKGLSIEKNESVYAKCYECSGYGENFPCGSVECPLWVFCPYQKNVAEEDINIRQKIRLQEILNKRGR